MKLELLTSRLRLTPLIEADIDISIDIWTDPEVVKFICEVATQDELRVEMPDSTRRGGDGCIGVWCVADRESGEKLGSAYLLPMPVEELDYDLNLLIPDQMPEGEIELGYFLKRSAWGKGYATEVSKCMVEFAFLEAPLTELVASVHEDNEASRKILEKTGFIYRERTLCWGVISPIYYITRNDWKKTGRPVLNSEGINKEPR